MDKVNLDSECHRVSTRTSPLASAKPCAEPCKHRVKSASLLAQNIKLHKKRGYLLDSLVVIIYFLVFIQAASLRISARGTWPIGAIGVE
jgi:hypothetical protein